jgi:4-amino-4-deoxy-L-arabinose transferase-like glycosyltransferase
LKNKAYCYSALIISILISGILLRIIRFPEIPPGLNIDEAVGAYEAFSLLETGKDKWGHAWPAYFPGWGSGQNVLLAYLTIPFVKIFGLTILSARLAALLFGLLTLPLFYFCISPLGRFPALLGLLLICVAPWHFMLSRWALESNMLPFCMLLGCTALTRALITQQKKWIIPALLPFALALYAYATTIVVLPILFGLILLFYFKQVRLQWQAWLLSLVLFFILAFPFLIFFIENHLLKSNISWTNQFFFTTAVLPSNRLDQVNSGTWLNTIYLNCQFLLAGFDDKTNYNLMPGYSVLLSFTLPLTAIGLVTGAYRILKNKRHQARKPGNIVMAVFLFWAIASLVFFLFFELNINRFNHFFLPAMVITVWLLHLFLKSLNRSSYKLSGKLFIIGWIIMEGSAGIWHYFTNYPQGTIRYTFSADMKEAFDAVHKLPVSQVYLTSGNMPVSLGYIYALFYLKYPPEEFQKNGDFEIQDGIYKVNRFGKYAFYHEYIDRSKDYGYLLRKMDIKRDGAFQREICYEDESWEVGIIKAGAN